MRTRSLWVSIGLGVLTFAATVLVSKIAFADDYPNGGPTEQGPYCCCTCGTGPNAMCTGFLGARVIVGMGCPPTTVCRASTNPQVNCSIPNADAGCQ